MAERAPIAARVAAARSMSPSTAAPQPSAPAGSGPSSPSSSASGSNTATGASRSPSASSAPSEAGGDPSIAGNAASPSETSDSGDGGSSSGDGSAAPTDAGASTESASNGEGGTYGSDKERIDAAVVALEKGDLAAVKAALGREVKLPRATEQAFTALSKREQRLKKNTTEFERKATATKAELDRAKADLARDSNAHAQVRRQHEQRYGYAVAGERAWEGGDMVGVAKSIERMCKGASLAQVTQRIAGLALGKDGGGSGNTAEHQALAESRKRLDDDKAAHEKRLADERAAREKEQAQRSHQQQRQTALGKFAERHGKHPFLNNPDDPGKADPEALDEAFGLYEKRWAAWQNGRGDKPTPKAVLDELHTREVRRLKRLGLDPSKTPPAPPAKVAPAGNAGRPPPPKRLPEPPPSNLKPPSREDTRTSRIALARKLTEQQTRGLRA